MARSSRDTIPTKKTFQNLPRDPFFHTMDFFCTKEIFTQLRHVNKEWNTFTKEELALKKLTQRCEEHPQHTNPKSFLSSMLISPMDPMEACRNYLWDNDIPLKYCAGFRGIITELHDIKNNMSFNPEIAKRFFSHLSMKEIQTRCENLEILFSDSINLCNRFKNKEKLTEQEYTNLLNLFQSCEEFSKITMDITLVGIGSDILLNGKFTNASLILLRELLIKKPLHDMTSRALIVLMDIDAPLFPLGLEDPALKPHLYKLNSEELDFAKKHNAWKWKRSLEESKSDIPTTPLKNSRSF